MLNQRQLEILLELCENEGQFMTASYFADSHGVSLRTIQNDMKAIRKEVEKSPCIRYESAVPKGSRIRIVDADAYTELRDSLYRQCSDAPAAGQNERIGQIVMTLLQQHRAVGLFDLENMIYVSRSTLFTDLKKVEEVLGKYHLELLRSQSRLLVDGKEIDKRRCISEQHLMNIPGAAFGDAQDRKMINRIKDILVRTFVANQHNVSEVTLNNAIIELYIAVKRMEAWFFIDDSELQVSEDLEPERSIAAEVFKGIGRAFTLRIPDAEIDYFAIYMKGKGNFTSEAAISEEINELTLDGLREIRNVCGIDLTDDINLRIALGLHLSSLVIRIRYNMQLDNRMTDYIRQTYPQGYDLATYFAAFLEQRYQKKVNEEEIAFLAVHLYKSLTDLQERQGTRHLLLISSLRRSENILLRQTLYEWFGSQIAELRFILPEEMNESFLDRYDTFITTEKSKYYEMGLALYISPFPGRQDYLNLKLAMDGFGSLEDVLSIFHKDLFISAEKKTDRDALLKDLCARCEKRFDLDGLYDAVMQRENMGSTYFGNGIAAAHPHVPLSPDTFIAVAVCRRPVVWDQEENKVQVVLLVHIGKNNPSAFQLWNYLSKIIGDDNFARQLASTPTFETFLEMVKFRISQRD